ncbi:hypothetical protein GCM10022240_29050 [Microbacterium kribbense]|uniref:Prepilin-type N-terminal cleavage/methylation domain-containing protein n=1 Tax=Microbacterium kribbense TaxID=433645 RepID=A0ABP7GUM3_9MICO
MRTIHNMLEADKARKENGEAGFSLIELIIVVVILGILAAIAIPIFLNIQDQAKQSSADTVAANAATQVASAVAQNTDPTTATFFDNFGADYTIAFTKPSTAPTLATLTTDNFCLTATASAATGGKVGTAGPAC